MSTNAQALELFSLGAALLAYAVLLVFLGVTWRKKITGRAAFLAGSLTLVWFAVWRWAGADGAAAVAESVAQLAWIALLLRALGLERPSFATPAAQTQTLMALSGVGLVGLMAVGVWLEANVDAALSAVSNVSALLLCVLGLVLVEQVASNTRADHRWKLRFLSIALGMAFVYGFVLHADAVLFGGVDPIVRALQPIVWTLAVPLIMLASLRNRRNPLNLNVSRAFVFRTGALLAAGAYLVILGAIGFYVRVFDSDVFEAALIMALLLGAVAVLAVGGSTQLRARIRAFATRHLYEYKYDYREEWLRVTDEMAHENPDDPLPERVHTAAVTHQRAGKHRLLPVPYVLGRHRLG